MQHARMWGSCSSSFRWRAALLAALSVSAIAIAGLAASSASAETTWLCKPGLASNPCTSSEEATVELPNGASFIEHAKPAKNPPIDCFYVYPTVSSKFTENANLEIGPEEKQIAIDQASRFSQTCKVYAPVYPQLTINAINTPGGVTPEGSAIAYVGVLTAFEEYLARYNNGRGFVLDRALAGLGDARAADQGTDRPQPRAAQAARLGDPARRQRARARRVRARAACSRTSRPARTPCRRTASSRTRRSSKNRPNPSLFGRVGSPLLGGSASEEEIKNDEVLCVNPSIPAPGRLPRADAALRVDQPVPGAARRSRQGAQSIDPVGRVPGPVHRPV